jgi:uncharacterized membrane protein YccF (DUF307 family)
VRFILNVIWLVLSGFWLAVGYLIAAIVMFILIITIPFGLQALKLAGYSLWPFGRHVERRADAGVASAIGNVIWFLLAGWWLAIAYIVTGVALFVTIIGIPLAIANFKMIPVALVPFGREIVSDRHRTLPEGPQPLPH